MIADKFHNTLIILRSAAITLWISIIAVYWDRRGIYKRERCDDLLRWWSSRLLRYIRLTLTKVNFDPHMFESIRPLIIMSNHSSLWDIPIILAGLPGSIRMLTKKELFRVPVWGRGLRAGEFISIDRDNRRQAFRDLEEARKKMETGVILWIAPEGTRSMTRRIGSFKKGGFMLAVRTGATVLPVGIRGAYDVLPPKTSRFHLGRHVELHIGRPIEASGYTGKRIELLMDEVKRQICELTGFLPKEADSCR